ncbi:MAG: sigma-54-dependent Fis family transcriptional regulator [bacterium]
MDVVLLDMRFDVEADRLLPLPGGPVSLRRQRRFQGVAILGAIRERFPDLPVVVLTAVEDLSLLDAGEELAQQSLTYMLDGEDLDAVRIRVHTALAESRRAQEEADILWGQDAAMGTVRRRLSVLARGRLPVILEGETGTGKSFLAERWLHARSGRPGPFVVLDLATIPTDLVPAHLFGATRGAYTGAVTDRKGVFELAHEGTLFIDEIQNVPLEVQKQLLLVLQDRKVRPLGSSREIPVDVKVVAASNTPLADAVRAGRFRPDLHMRCPRPPASSSRPCGSARGTSRSSSPPGQPGRPRLRHRRPARPGGRGGGAPPTAPCAWWSAARAAATRTPCRSPCPARPGSAWRPPWPGNVRELAMVMHNIITFTLVGAVDAIGVGLELHSPRLQVDPGLVADLLSGPRRRIPSRRWIPTSSPSACSPAPRSTPCRARWSGSTWSRSSTDRRRLRPHGGAPPGRRRAGPGHPPALQPARPEGAGAAQGMRRLAGLAVLLASAAWAAPDGGVPDATDAGTPDAGEGRRLLRARPRAGPRARPPRRPQGQRRGARPPGGGGSGRRPRRLQAGLRAVRPARRRGRQQRRLRLAQAQRPRARPRVVRAVPRPRSAPRPRLAEPGGALLGAQRPRRGPGEGGRLPGSGPGVPGQQALRRAPPGPGRRPPGPLQRGHAPVPGRPAPGRRPLLGDRRFSSGLCPR